MPGSAGSPATRKSMANGSSPATKTARSSRLAPQDIAILQKKMREQEVELAQLRVASKVNHLADSTIDEQQDEIKSLRNKLQESEQARTDLQRQLIEGNDVSGNRDTQQEKYNSLIVDENGKLRQELLVKTKELNLKDKEIENMQVEQQKEKAGIQQLKIQLEQTRAKFVNHESTLFESEQHRKNLQDEYQGVSILPDNIQCLDTYNHKLEEQYNIIRDLTVQLKKLREDLRASEARKKLLEISNADLSTKLKSEKDKTQKIEELEKIIADLKKERDLLLKQMGEHEKEKEMLYKKYDKIRKEVDDMLREMQNKIDESQDRIKQLEDELFEKNEELTNKDQKIMALTDKLLKQQKEMDQAQKVLKAYEDMKKQLAKAKEDQDKMMKDKAQKEKDLKEMAQLLKAQQDCNNALLDQIESLKEDLKAKDEEMEAMKRYMQSNNQKNSIYMPDKDCNVDTALAEYINNFPDRQKLRIMFMRESSGVYFFGSRRVFVKMEQDKIRIRVGGGYLSIDEFLDIYTPMELERLERNDPMKKFAEKVAISKALNYNSPSRHPAEKSLAGSEASSVMNSSGFAGAAKKQRHD